jgi:hypothetical protein
MMATLAALHSLGSTQILIMLLFVPQAVRRARGIQLVAILGEGLVVQQKILLVKSGLPEPMVKMVTPLGAVDQAPVERVPIKAVAMAVLL